MRNPLHPRPAPPAFGQDTLVAETSASIFSKLTFSWLDPFIKVGFSRPLQKEDLWQLPERQLTDSITRTVEAKFYQRCPPEQRPPHMRSAGTSQEQVTAVPDEPEKVDVAAAEEGAKAAEDPKAKKSPEFDRSLLKAVHSTFLVPWWTAGFLTLLSTTLKTTTPLVTKVLLTWLTESYIYYRTSDEEHASLGLNKPRGVGFGIGIAFAIFAMQEMATILTTQWQLIAQSLGMSLRTCVIGLIFRKALRLSGRARLEHSVGQITTMISTDATGLEHSTPWVHYVWVAPIQLIIGIGLLISNLGYSALVGLGFMILGFPLQGYLISIIYAQRKKGVEFTDKRVRLLTEVLQGIRLVKYYAWESFYSHQIGLFRRRELKTIRKTAISLSSLIASVTTVPVIAIVLSFITYSLTGHQLNVATIFASLQLFGVIQEPLLWLPLIGASVAQALVAFSRVSKFLVAEEITDISVTNPESKLAIDAEGDFQWESTAKLNSDTSTAETDKDKKAAEDKEKESPPNTDTIDKPKKKGWFSKKGKDPVLPTAQAQDEKPEVEKTEVTGESTPGSLADNEDKPFGLPDLQFKVAKGAFVAIVGRVGSGKSSLLQALIGEMRRTRGKVVFSSSVAYVPQSAWIMNASLRENITFGRGDDEERFRKIVQACCLEKDIEMLPHGENTEIGEKGINLSGGQKARVSLARAAYSGADIVLMDDSLSAVDAYVGKRILEDCILSGPFADKTRVIATHSLHILDKTDYIYVMDGGKIVSEGTYQDLLLNSEIFSRVMEEYGTSDPKEATGKSGDTVKGEGRGTGNDAKESQKPQTALMQEEERVVGAVSGRVYSKYLEYAGGIILLPILLLFLALYQGAAVANNLFLGFWTSDRISGFSQGQYMATYAGLGVASAVFSFSLNLLIFITCLEAGWRIFKAALEAVVHSPVSFFDTTPIGRILSRFSKDQETLDQEIAGTLYPLLTLVSSVLGTAGLIFYTFPYLGIALGPLLAVYLLAAIYYRRTSVETKRLDSLMRSTLYASYSGQRSLIKIRAKLIELPTESLTGLSTIRGYSEQNQFIRRAEHGLDMENRALYMTIALQQWLGLRLESVANLLVLGIGLFGAGERKTVNPANVGVVLSYTLSMTQVFSQVVQIYANNEQNFNAVERLLHYTELPSEGDTTKPNDPPPSWPEKGTISFNNVKMAYREGLPLVLKGVDFTINEGEKIGVVGRTGAGKSSLLQALFRIVNLQDGSIVIDGHDIKDVGLETLRTRLALVPQDSTLFLGTLRDNLDPQGTRTDAEIISALQRAWLLPADGSPADSPAETKFSLDAPVSDEGSNYSAGEKQLLALCRALIKRSRIIILDEATSSVDVETDAKLQRTIQTEFASSTLLCIAHRLNTIVYYDRIIAMDDGKVAEFDTPLNLFDNEDSIFRSLCNEAGLSRQDIVRIRTGAVSQVTTEIPSAEGI
ncbi:multidrug resistance-associated ABC transporter [Cristinia sonorae]|uniref:Multidrug resistance-associated ABC transporter n=1 Tax=Cristinia sonorae TaxID=1940300 RepID=A0A8K0XSQ5_9AGAR|nr:multidrug resistance-associated ABC transporter [Cristinia sonorae]